MKKIFLIGSVVVSIPLGGCMISDGPREREHIAQAVEEDNAENKQGASSPEINKYPSLPDVRTTQDTVKAALIVLSKSPTVEFPLSPETSSVRVYTIQIGAYTDVKNALRNQKIAKERFTIEHVFTEFDEKDGLYRVTVGRLLSKEGAVKFFKMMQQTFPQEYGKCWIKEIVP